VSFLLGIEILYWFAAVPSLFTPRKYSSGSIAVERYGLLDIPNVVVEKSIPPVFINPIFMLLMDLALGTLSVTIRVFEVSPGAKVPRLIDLDDLVVFIESDAFEVWDTINTSPDSEVTDWGVIIGLDSKVDLGVKEVVMTSNSGGIYPSEVVVVVVVVIFLLVNGFYFYRYVFCFFIYSYSNYITSYFKADIP